MPIASGRIEVIVGSMFSGKTEELIRRMRRAEIAKQRIQIFKPSTDTRYHADYVTSHSAQKLPSTTVTSANEIYKHLDELTRVIGIDEGQFFDDSLVDVVEKLANQGLRVIIAGLDMDWQGKPFEPMPHLMAIAEDVTKQHAICVTCGESASRTQRLSASRKTVLVGDANAYEARCRSCYESPDDVVKNNTTDKSNTVKSTSSTELTTP